MARALEQQIMREIGLSEPPHYYEAGRRSARWDRTGAAGRLPEVIQRHVDAGDGIAAPNAQLMRLVAAVADGGPRSQEADMLPTWSACLDAIQAQIAEASVPGTIDERVIPVLQGKYAGHLSTSYVAPPPVVPTRTTDPERTLKNVGVVAPSEGVLRPIARRLFAGMTDEVEGPDELAVATFVHRMTTQTRSADSVGQFASGVLGAVTDARRADGRRGRAELDRFDVETAIRAVEELAPVLEFIGSSGPLDVAVVIAARDAIIQTSSVALQASPSGAGALS